MNNAAQKNLLHPMRFDRERLTAVTEHSLQILSRNELYELWRLIGDQ
jgi:hypothetical protein